MKNSINLIINCLFISIVKIVCSEKLLGVTLQVNPYVYIRNNTFYGYCIDLMDQISRVAGFEYSLYLSPDKQYGLITPNGRVNGMIGEVFNRAADFAIADLTVTEDRKRYVEFTEPFMKFGLSALIHKSNIGNMESFKDLSKQTKIKYGTYRNGKTISLFYESTDETISRMYFFMMRNRSKLMSNMSQGIELVKNSKYAFIQESPANEYIAANDCDLTVIYDNMDYFKREYAIAMPLDSYYLKKFNHAIKQLKVNGTLDQLRDKYWKLDCNNALKNGFHSVILFIMVSFNLIMNYE